MGEQSIRITVQVSHKRSDSIGCNTPLEIPITLNNQKYLYSENFFVTHADIYNLGVYINKNMHKKMAIKKRDSIYSLSKEKDIVSGLGRRFYFASQAFSYKQAAKLLIFNIDQIRAKNNNLKVSSVQKKHKRSQYIGLVEWNGIFVKPKNIKEYRNRKIKEGELIDREYTNASPIYVLFHNEQKRDTHLAKMWADRRLNVSRGLFILNFEIQYTKQELGVIDRKLIDNTFAEVNKNLFLYFIYREGLKKNIISLDSFNRLEKQVEVFFSLINMHKLSSFETSIFIKKITESAASKKQHNYSVFKDISSIKNKQDLNSCLKALDNIYLHSNQFMIFKSLNLSSEQKLVTKNVFGFLK